MKWVRFAVLICFFAVLQADLLKVVAVTSLNIKPDLLLVLMVFFAFFAGTTDAVVTSFAIGFAADIVASGFPMGTRTISFGLIGTVLAYLHSVIAIRQMLHQAIAVFIAGFLTGILSLFLTFLTGQQTVPNVYSVILGTSLYSGLIGPFLFLPCAWLMRIKTHRPRRP